MAPYMFSVQLLLLISAASATMFLGGTMRIIPKGRHPDGSLQVELHFRQTFSYCYNYFDWTCWNGNCGHILASKSGFIDQSTDAGGYANGWCESETVETRYLPSDDPFEMREASCCWIYNNHHIGYWRLFTHVDLKRRSDTWQLNNSPNNAILPFLRVPSNCQRAYPLMTVDPDGDQVICRYGTIPNIECYACIQPSGFYLDEGNCILHYVSTDLTWPETYGFELVVEDFPRSSITLTSTNGTQTIRSPVNAQRHKRAVYSTTAPSTTTQPPTTTTSSTSTTAQWQTNSRGSLSTISLQFSLLVDSPAPSCTEGEYLPRFVYPTPSHGDHLNAQVNEEFEMKIGARASHSTVGDIIFSGPLNTTKHRIAQGEFYLRWTPTQDNLGDHIPICFIVEATFLYQNYQSEMRCVVLEVEHAKAHVICNETSMTVVLDKSSFDGLNYDQLRLNEPSNTACRLHSNGTHVIGIIPLSACGTQIEEDNDNLIFKNEITTVEDVRDMITRKHLLEIRFSCQYPKAGNVTLGFNIHRDNVTLIERGFGTFTYNFEFYPDHLFDKMVNPTLYPLEYEVGERIYMQIEATTSVNNTVLFVESCRASPYDNPNYQPTYPIIENGCSVDPTIVIHSPGHNKKFRFSIETFKFIGLHDQVYISCSVILCEAGNNNTRCSKGCVASNQKHYRGKREALIETGVHFISQGPLRLRSTKESESRVTGLNLNLAFIAGCLLAAVAMISGVMIHRFKRAAVRYQPLPTTEQ